MSSEDFRRAKTKILWVCPTALHLLLRSYHFGYIRALLQRITAEISLNSGMEASFNHFIHCLRGQLEGERLVSRLLISISFPQFFVIFFGQFSDYLYCHV